MKWIQNFSDSKIPFYVYDLNTGDYITYTLKTIHDKYIIILYGLIYIIKVFTNQEIAILGILEKDDIIREPKNTKHCNYGIVAIQKTFVMSFTWKDIIENKYVPFPFLIDILKSCNRTLYKYEEMNSILLHKSTKNRIIQLILFLCKEFCIIENDTIMIPFYLSQTTISAIIGTNKSTVNKIIKNMCNIDVISYSYHKYICIKDPFLLSYCYKNQQNYS